MKKKPQVELRVDCNIPTKYGEFRVHLFSDDTDEGKKEHLALVMGNVRGKEGVISRIHSECFTGDVFGCQRCDCQDQLHGALDMIRQRAEGVLLYLRQEGRGIGLENKLKAYNLQDEGFDTVDANLELGFEGDYRKYDIAADMLRSLGVRSVELITNSPQKIQGLNDAGIPVLERRAIVINSVIRDRTTLFQVKRRKLGHLFDEVRPSSTESTKQEEGAYPLVADIFDKNTPIPSKTVEISEKIKEGLVDTFGDSLSAILLQGSNMRGDGSIEKSDFDYIILFKTLPREVIDKISAIKKASPYANFLYLTEGEYRAYPRDRRLQFFISRKVYGDFDFGEPPSNLDTLDTAITYAVQLKDSIRPLLFEYCEQGKKEEWKRSAHVCLKRLDDCFFRVVALYTRGKYPLHRSHLREVTEGQKSIAQILDFLDEWYSVIHSAEDVHKCLITADRLLHLFLRRYGNH